MPTLYLTEDYSLVRRDSQDTLLVQIPEKRAKDGATPAPARKEHIPLVKIDEVVVLGEVTLTASALHLLLERNQEAHQNPPSAVGFWKVDPILALRMFPESKRTHPVMLQAGRAPGGKRGQRALLSPVCQLHEPGRNGRWAITKRNFCVYRISTTIQRGSQ